MTAIGAALIIVLISLLPKFLYFCFDSHLHHHYVGLRFWVYRSSILLDCLCQVELLPWLHWSGLQLVVMYVSIVVVTFLVRVHPVICHTSPVPGYKFICATFISLTVLRTLILCCIFCILCTPEFVSGAFISEDRRLFHLYLLSCQTQFTQAIVFLRQHVLRVLYASVFCTCHIISIL